MGNDCTPWGCPEVASETCFSAGKDRVSFKQSAEPARRAFSWKWAEGADGAVQSDFGDPQHGRTGFKLCVDRQTGGTSSLAMGAAIPAGGTCGGRSCWTSIGTGGWSYKDKAAGRGGVRNTMLKGGSAGRPVVRLAARGSSLSLPPPASGSAFFDADSVIVQLYRSDSTSGPGCWSSTFDVRSATRNDGERFKGRTPR